MAIPNIPPAYMGYVGFIRFRPNGENPYIVRATSTSLAAKQEITKPNVIDSRYDMTVYQLGPKEMEGDVSFPAIYDPQGGASVIESCYRHAITRDAAIGSLLEMDIDVRYAPNDGSSHMADFNYLGCIINTFKFSVAQSDAVNITVGVIAKDRVEPGFSGNNSLAFSPFTEFNFDDTSGSGTGTYGTAKENSRIVTWADARFEIFPSRGMPSGTPMIGGEYIRSYDVNINNNAERFYTLNGKLVPQAIGPKKREISGTTVVLGRHPALAQCARTNQDYAFEYSYINFGFVANSSGVLNNTFGVKLPNVIFQLEEMELKNELFETTINWHSLPAAGTFSLFDDPLLNTDVAFSS